MIAAFFDIDGTLARTSLMIQHFQRLIKYDIIDEEVWYEKIKPIYEQYDKRYQEYDNYLYVIADVYKDKLKKINKQFNEYISKKVIEDSGEVVYKYTRSRIKYHESKGHKVIFISGSPDFLVKEMAKKYNVFEYRGSKYLVDEKDDFTGEVEQMWDSISKNRVIDEFVEKYDIDLTKSYSYGDTSGDFSMLKRVGHPIAINPTRELIKLIDEEEDLRERAQIIVERKDVIYHLKSNVDILLI